MNHIDHLRTPSTVDRIIDAIDSPFGLGVWVGCIIGCFLTVGLAYCWSVLL
jgi:hypothetical protein